MQMHPGLAHYNIQMFVIYEGIIRCWGKVLLTRNPWRHNTLALSAALHLQNTRFSGNGRTHNVTFSNKY